MSSGLSPNPSDTTNVLLKLLINKVNPGTFSDQDVALPVWTGPSYTIVWVQSLAYTSLSISLLVGVGAVLGKQWLGSFKTSRFGHGSLKERCIRRQQKLDGLEIWRFDALMSFIPSCLQLSLLFFGIALSADMWSFQKTIAYVIIGCTVCGQGLYILTLVAAVKYPDCPYQTLVSMFIVEVWKRLWNPRPGTLWDHVKKTMTTYSRLWRRQRAQTVHLGYLPTMVSVLPKQPSPGVLYLNHSPPQPVEAHAVRWIFDVSTDGDILTDAAKMVAEVEWPQESDITSVANRLQSQLKACFDPTQQLLPIAEDRALACLKALCHCFLKIPIRDDNYKHHSAIYSAISKYRNIFLSDTAFLLISGIICKEGVTDINSISSSDRMWLAHLIPYCLHQGRCGKDSDWRDVVIMFTAACLRDPHSPSRLVVDCLISAGLLMGLLVDQTQLAKLDKSEERYAQFCYAREITLTTLQRSNPPTTDFTGKTHGLFVIPCR